MDIDLLKKHIAKYIRNIDSDKAIQFKQEVTSWLVVL